MHPPEESSPISLDFLEKRNFIIYPTAQELTCSLEAEKNAKKFKSSPTEEKGNVVMLFKSDLRCKDNPALYHASRFCKQNQKSLIALCVWCPEEWNIHGFAACKQNLALKALFGLRDRLSCEFGIKLFIIHEPKAVDVPSTIVCFCAQIAASALFFNRQYEWDEGQRDKLMEQLLQSQLGIATHSFHDQCVVPPGSCTTQAGNVFTIFTPFKKCWLSLLEKQPELLQVFPEPETFHDSQVQLLVEDGDFDLISEEHSVFTSLNHHDQSSILVDEGKEEFSNGETKKETTKSPSSMKQSKLTTAFQQNSKSDNQLVGASKCPSSRYSSNEKTVEAEADDFIANRCSSYDKTRDFPSMSQGTSGLSPYIALGMISAKTLLIKAQKIPGSGSRTWISELCWRDFYRHIIVAFPRVARGHAFKEQTEKIAWSQDQAAFRLWCQGKTGVPIVDAGMRQLNESGWMHNRLRMITAAYLTKDLLINWQWGERYFLSKLIDGDFASNNGGWQWSASTGTDAQPYFRIFNPKLQAAKFDPKGEFVKHWVPELGTSQYPTKPLVDHDEARKRTLEAFKAVLAPKRLN